MTTESAKTLVEVRYGTEVVDGINIFYRESGIPQKRAVVLLHGYPASSHMYRDVLVALGADWFLIAPDYPGFGNSGFPDPKDYEYTFDNLARTIDKFLDQKGITEFVLGMQDYGAPVGYRLATKYPDRVKGLIVMNGNAYEEGFHPETSAPVRDFWNERTAEKEAAIATQLMSLEGIKWMYVEGTRKPEGINPDNWVLDFARIDRPGQEKVQLDLFYDYQNNVKSYPEWQAYLRERQPPTLVAWGSNDPIFVPAGAEAYRKDLKEIDFYMFDTGHFALEEDAVQIIDKIRDFLARRAFAD
ncbi:alpha/beta hydrolase [Rubellicoccus peritrichatus]|uniref:Alpha/beta hydrolase n=1 Tax=Rubellicoccus peritrichatus TaxID=3080537 RepID=A0AAQ3L7S8_9BACT|nr:alpha/beta hydrolase [Puniceicoccus sp. CR14]WOO40242.1 alpha/beta hydrolase [Puniceicoccus sp. CR14]